MSHQNINAEFAEFQRWRANQPAPNPEKRINIAVVRPLCGGVSDMTIYRWLKYSNFPKPEIINRRRYWRRADVIAWLESHQSA